MQAASRGSGRSWPVLDPLLFAGALAIHAAALPLGLERIADARAVIDGQALGGAPDEAQAPLALLAIRLVGWLPLGDGAARTNLAAALLAALAVTLAGRLCCEALVRGASARPERQDATLPLAATGAVGAAALTVTMLQAATSGVGASVTLALVAGAWLVALRLAAPMDGAAGRPVAGRPSSRARLGLGLAFLAGLCAGVQPVAAPLVWPLAVGLTLRGLTRGERWPVLAPLLFCAALGIGLYGVAAESGAVTMAAVTARLWPGHAFGGGLVALARELAEQIGVVAVLLGAGGILALAGRAPGLATWLLLAVLASGAMALSAAPAAAETARAAALLAFTLPMAAGIGRVAGRLGRARVAAAAALAVMAMVGPALYGGATRWRRPGLLPARLVEQGLARVPPGGRVDPGSPQMRELFRYAGALGLRPDATFER